jgi:hypothetical protein
MRCFAFLLLLAAVLYGQTASKVASQTRLLAEGGPLYAKIEGTEVRVAAAAFRAWIVANGAAIVYSTANGSGGFEGEGQSLYRYDVATGRKSKIISESFEITAVEAAQSTDGKVALLVSLEDGGLGASHIAVVDLQRGEVFRQDGAKFAGSSGGSFTVAWYRDQDWDDLRENVQVSPYKTQVYDLDQILKRPVIVNTPARR